MSMASCGGNTVFIVEDPFVGEISSSGWPLADPLFNAMARIRGLTLQRVVTGPGQDAVAYLEAAGPQLGEGDMILVSPLEASNLDSASLPDGPGVIVFGAEPPALRDKAHFFLLDRGEAMKEAGALAASYRREFPGRVLALFRTGSLRLDAEREAFEEGYLQNGGFSADLVIIPVSRGVSGNLPRTFLNQIEGATLLVLFGGIHNTQALADTAERGIPAIIEWAEEASYEDDRFIASVEWDIKKTRQTLIDLLASDWSPGATNVPAVLRIPNDDRPGADASEADE